jgi:hypothetical protein
LAAFSSFDTFALDVGHGAPLNAADHHAGLGLIELGTVFVRADFGEQLCVNLRQVHAPLASARSAARAVT